MLNHAAEQLKKITETYAEILLNISSDKKKHLNKIHQLKKDFDIRKNQLKISLYTGEYTGKDTYGITAKVLQTLKVKLELNADFDLLMNVINGLSAEEVDAFCLEEGPKEITQAIANIENLVILMGGMNQEVLPVFLHGIRNEVTCIIKRNNDLSNLLWVIDVGKK